MKYGAIDIGTNAARLLIGEVIENDGKHFVQKLSYTRVPLRLGMDVFNDGFIPGNKIEMFVKTMKAFQMIADVYEVVELRACATSAMREAKNGKEVKAEIFNKTGLNIDVIDGEEEAEIIFSTFSLMNLNEGLPYLVIDVGGGSTEISVFADGKKIAGKSFEIGTIRLLKQKVENEEWDNLNSWIASNLVKINELKIFGTGGNINKIHKLLQKKVSEPVTFNDLKDFHEEISPLTIEERINRYFLKSDRADVIVPATEIYLHILKILDKKEMLVPKIGLSDGIIYNLYLNETF